MRVCLFREGEDLISEIYIVGTNDITFKKSLELTLPIRPRPYDEMFETDVIMRESNSEHWKSIEFEIEASVTSYWNLRDLTPSLYSALANLSFIVLTDLTNL